MSFVNPNTYGIKDNPLIFSQFIAGNGSGGGFVPPANGFLLLDNTFFLLLDGTNFLLLGP